MRQLNNQKIVRISFSLTKGRRSRRWTLLSISAVHQLFYISICIWTLPTADTTFIKLKLGFVMRSNGVVKSVHILKLYIHVSPKCLLALALKLLKALLDLLEYKVNSFDLNSFWAVERSSVNEFLFQFLHLCMLAILIQILEIKL